MITLRDVRRTHRGRGEVLAGIDLDLAPGRPVVVTGGNGSGKSTLLRIVAGGSTPTAGEVGGRPDVVGYVPGHVTASANLPARVHLERVAALHGGDPAAAADVLRALHFAGDLDAPLTALSSGNARKAALATALSCDAGLVVLDEPWSHLDAPAASALDALLARLTPQVALLVADHSGHGARLPGAAVLRLHDGTLSPAGLPPGTFGAPASAPRPPGASGPPASGAVVPGPPVSARPVPVRRHRGCPGWSPDPGGTPAGPGPRAGGTTATGGPARPGHADRPTDPHLDPVRVAAGAEVPSTAPARTGTGVRPIARVVAAARYLAADLARSQRLLLPVLVFAVVGAALLVDRPGPPPGIWPVTALLLYPVAAWLAVVAAGVDPPDRRPVTRIAAGGPGRVAAGVLLLALAADAVLAVVAVAVPALLAAEPYPPAAWAAGLAAHLATSAAGTAVGLLAARPFVDRVGWSFVVVTAIVAVTVGQSGLPPVGTAVRALTDGTGIPWGSAVAGVAAAVLVSTAAWLVERRR